MPLTLIVPAAPEQPSVLPGSAASAKDQNAPALYYRELRHPLGHDDADTLRQMRLASGTYYDRIPTWLEELRSGQRLMWFVYLNPLARPNPTPTATSPLSPTSLSFILNDTPRPPSPKRYDPYVFDSGPIAMVCLLRSNPQDPSLASIEARRCELTSLWIYPLYRPLGVGAFIIAEMERQATKRCGASFITFNTTAGATGTLKTFQRIGYTEYKPREHRYSVTDVMNAGLPVESTLAAFFEKRIDLKMEDN